MHRARSPWRNVLLACGALGVAFFAWLWLQTGLGNGAKQAGAVRVAAPAPSAGLPVTGSSGPEGAALTEARLRQIQLWHQRHERAQHVYETYRNATRYPPTARPIAEHPDQVTPFAPAQEDTVMRDPAGKPVAGFRIRSTQDRVFVTGAESVRLTIEAVDANGGPVPLLVRHSAAQSLADTKMLVTVVRVPVPFVDDGSGVDVAAGDGRYSAQFTPASQGFGAQPGTIRVVMELQVDGKPGAAAFDVVYDPDVPGTWSGVREALEDGDLHFYLKAQVSQPGRYVASARLQDANGVPFAVLQYNDEVAAGAVEFRLSVPGLLVHDHRPAFPLRLVDVEAFLLKPDTFPDRAMMPRLAGVVHTTAVYQIDNFAAQEWRSEQRDRYLAEYIKDLVRAEDELSRLRR